MSSPVFFIIAVLPRPAGGITSTLVGLTGRESPHNPVTTSHLCCNPTHISKPLCLLLSPSCFFLLSPPLAVSCAWRWICGRVMDNVFWFIKIRKNWTRFRGERKKNTFCQKALLYYMFLILCRKYYFSPAKKKKKKEKEILVRVYISNVRLSSPFRRSRQPGWLVAVTRL